MSLHEIVRQFKHEGDVINSLERDLHKSDSLRKINLDVKTDTIEQEQLSNKLFNQTYQMPKKVVPIVKPRIQRGSEREETNNPKYVFLKNVNQENLNNFTFNNRYKSRKRSIDHKKQSDMMATNANRFFSPRVANESILGEKRNPF